MALLFDQSQASGYDDAADPFEDRTVQRRSHAHWSCQNLHGPSLHTHACGP